MLIYFSSQELFCSFKSI